jgi:hypothetical protein
MDVLVILLVFENQLVHTQNNYHYHQWELNKK